LHSVNLYNKGIQYNTIQYNTNFLRQVEFAERKSSHIGVKSTQQPSSTSKEYPIDYKSPLSGSEEITVTCVRLFLIYRSQSAVSSLIPIEPFLDNAWIVWMMRLVCQCAVYTDQWNTTACQKNRYAWLNFVVQ